MFSTVLTDLRGKVEALGAITQRTDVNTGIVQAVIGRIQWGHGGNYIEIKVERIYIASVATGNWIVTLTTPWSGPFTTTGSTWEDVSVTWQMDAAKVSTKISGISANWEMDELRVYVNGSLWQTLASHTDSSFTYDQRLDRLSCGGWKFTLTNRTLVSCGMTTDYWVLADLYPVYGYERQESGVWLDDPLNLTIFAYPDPSCECQEAFPVLSWLRTASCIGRHWAETHDIIPATHEVTCHCPEGFTETQAEIDEIHYPSELDRDFGFWIHMTPSNSGMNGWSAESASECYSLLDAPPGETVITDSGFDPLSRCAYEYEISRTEKLLFCQTRLQEMLCILLPPGAPTPMDPCVDNDDSGCVFNARSELTLDGPCADAVKEPFSLAVNPMGWYEEVYNCSGNIMFYNWDHPIPTGDIHHMSLVTNSGNDSHPKIAYDDKFRRYVVYARDASGTLTVRMRISDDDGRSWRAETTESTLAKYPTLLYDEFSQHFALLVFKYVSGTSGPGNIWIKVRPPDSSAFGAEFTVKDPATVALIVADTTYHVVAPKTASGPWVLVCVIDGESAQSHWMSFDFGISWRRY